MDCVRAQRLMALAIGGDVTAATRASVEAHAAACPACGEEWERYGGAAAALRAAQGAPEPPGGWGGIWAGVAEHVAPGEPARAADGSPGPGGEIVRLGAGATAGRGAAGWLRWTGLPGGLRVAAGLLVGFTAGFTIYHVAFRAAGAPGTPELPVRDIALVVPPVPAMIGPEPAPGPAPAPVTVRDLWGGRVGAQVGWHPVADVGWTVRAVTPGGAAEASGLRPDDALRAINGVEVPRTPEAMDGLLARLLGEYELRLRVRRGGEEREVVVRLERER